MKYHNEQEVAQKVLDYVKEELEGICEYNELYESLRAIGLNDEAIDIEKIASDEYRHADKLWRMLGNFDINVPQTINELWDKVEEIFDK